ncbi:MAG TPA: hypothetical protein VHG71_07305 [Verrucomicrobiae bacterium]|nr:hypothetical protein [Verrucomicrobiae bacterium]
MKPKVSVKNHLCGIWVASNPDDTDDYFEAEYHISVQKGKFHVIGIDKLDDEEFVISNVKWNGIWLTFKTLMPSTRRIGFMKMRTVSQNEIELKFTFTVTETWRRKSKE